MDKFNIFKKFINNNYIYFNPDKYLDKLITEAEIKKNSTLIVEIKNMKIYDNTGTI